MSRTRFKALSVVLDVLLVNLGYILAFLIRFGGELPSFNFNAYLVLSPLITAFYIAGAWTYGLYDPERSDTGWAVVRSAAAAATVGFVLTAAVAFFGGTATASFNRPVILIAWPLVLLLLAGWRLVFLRVGNVRWPEQRVLIVGTGAVSVELADELVRRAKWGWRVTGLIDPTSDDAAPECSETRWLPRPGPRVGHRSTRARPRCQPGHRGQPDRLARARRVARLGRRRSRTCRRRSGALRDIHRHRGRHYRRRAADADHPLDRPALLRGSQASHRSRRLRADSRSSPARSCSSRASRSC